MISYSCIWIAEGKLLFIDEFQAISKILNDSKAGDSPLIKAKELQVGKGEVGKVIGKQGRTAEAIRTILNAASTKARKRTILDIIE